MDAGKNAGKHLNLEWDGALGRTRSGRPGGTGVLGTPWKQAPSPLPAATHLTPEPEGQAVGRGGYAAVWPAVLFFTF